MGGPTGLDLQFDTVVRRTDLDAGAPVRARVPLVLPPTGVDPADGRGWEERTLRRDDDDRTVLLAPPPSAQTGDVLVVEGAGASDPHRGLVGDLHVRLDVYENTPEPLSAPPLDGRFGLVGLAVGLGLVALTVLAWALR